MLHAHSVFSFHAGVCPIKEYVARAKLLGYKSLALTDTNRMSGLILFYTECLEQGIKPILGVELSEPGKPLEHIVILAKNAEGYGDLCEITTQRHVHAQSFSFANIFAKPWPNLIFFTNYPRLLELLAHTPNRASLFAELINNSTDTRNRSKVVETTAQRLAIPLMVSNNSFFLDKSDWETHKILVAIGLNSTLTRLKPGEFASEKAYLQSPAEMAAHFPNHAEALCNTQRIADMCNVTLKLNEWILPEITVPQGYTPDTYLEHIAFKGLDSHYLHTPDYAKAKAIQEMELKVISKLRYSSYFVMVKQIRDWANQTLRMNFRKPKDCTILRGSAANSMTFYNIDASDLDPIKYDLYFQRFLNEDRASPPDADLDFGWDEREKVQDYFVERWGQDRVALLCTTNHFRFRAAFRETAKVFGYSEEQISAMDNKPSRDPEVRRILEQASKIQGKPRFLGQHPGGIIVTNQPIWRHVACEYSNGEKNRIVTQIDMHNGIDELGLIKFDILGNGSLSVLRDALTQIADQHNPDPEVWDLEKCYADPSVRSIIRNGRTRGIFYIESPAQMRLNAKSQAETFEEVTITSSLVRPAGTAYTGIFVERHRKAKQGIKDWEYLHPSLEPILKETHDVCAFQEDITKICHQVAGLSFKQSDKVRKLMNSLHNGDLPPEEWRATADAFIQGCMAKNGLTQEQALELWERVSSFTGFSFCKSHSASYAQLSYKCAFLKCHYPAQFLAAVISNNHGFYRRDVYLDEARRWGIRILPMDINESGVKYYGKHNWMRPGLMHVRSLSQKAMEAVVVERNRNGRFHHLVDFVQRTPIHRKETEYLIKVGAFDGFGLTQPELISLLHGSYNKIKPHMPALFSEEFALGPQEMHPGLADYTLTQKCMNELHLLGYMLSGNILDIIDLHPASRDAVPASEIRHYAGKRVKIFGRPITERVHYVAQSGRHMQFLTLEDKTECMDVILWPDVYEKYMETVSQEGPFEIWGKVSEEWGTYTVQAERIRAVEWSPAQIDFERAEKRLANSFKNISVYPDVVKYKAA